MTKKKKQTIEEKITEIIQQQLGGIIDQESKLPLKVSSFRGGKMTINRWDKYFMMLAETVASNSRCHSRKIGAVIVKDKSIISTGYNGPPRGVPHCNLSNGEPGCPRKERGITHGKGLGMCPAGHAESNAIVNAARMGICVKGGTLYCACGVPCKNCMIAIINAGITKVVCFNSNDYYDGLSKWLAEKSSLIIFGTEER